MVKKVKIKFLLLLAMFAIGIISIWSCSGDIKMIEPTYNLQAIRADIKPLGELNADQLPESSNYYLDFYGLNPEKELAGVEHFLGTFQSGGYQITGHIFRPAEYSAAIVLMHGYLNHCGQLKNIIRFLLENGYAVCTYDKPGHGLSGGKEAWMDNFDKYADVMDDFKTVISEICHGPYHVIGFSHGCCAVIQRQLEGKEDFFGKTILVAPLLRPVQWKKARISYRLYMLFKDEVKRLPRNNTTEPDFVKFSKTKDFLHSEKVPLVWVKGLEKWNKKIKKLSARDCKILIIQGDRDSTVDWKYNTKMLKGKFDAKLVIIEGAKHELYNESKLKKEKVFTEIKNYLESSS